MKHLMGVALIGTLGLAPAAHAAFVSLPFGGAQGAIVKVGEGCGAGFWRGPGGHCNPFTGPGGTNRGTRYECPPGYYIGPGGQRCQPVR